MESGDVVELGLHDLVDLVKVVSTLIALGVLSIQDLKTRELSALLVYAYLFTSIALFAISVIVSDMVLPLLIIYAAFSLMASAGLFTVLFKLGLVGDGDVYVSLALGLTFSYPSLYRFTLSPTGILPPSLVVILYAALTSMALMLVNAIVVFTKYRSLLSALSAKHKVFLPLISKPVKLRDYLSGKLRHYFPIQTFTVSSSGVVVEYKLLTRVDVDEVSKLKQLLDRGLLSPEIYIWVTPGIPFIFHLFLGVVALIVFGDKPLVHLLIKIFSGV